MSDNLPTDTDTTDSVYCTQANDVFLDRLPKLIYDVPAGVQTFYLSDYLCVAGSRSLSVRMPDRR